jgi:ligand-binding sensor domain-containing protein
MGNRVNGCFPHQARSLVADPLGGGLWLAFPGSVVYLKGGQIHASYTVAAGLGGGHIRDLQLDREGTLWAATETGASRLKNGRVATLTSKNGLHCDDARWVMEDDEHSVWIYMACDLARIALSELNAWVVSVTRQGGEQVRSLEYDRVVSVTPAESEQARPKEPDIYRYKESHMHN